MRLTHQPDVHERPIRHDVQHSLLPRVAFWSGPATSVRLSPAISPASAIPSIGEALDFESACPHVRRARPIVDLSGCEIRAASSRADLSGRIGFKFGYNLE